MNALPPKTWTRVLSNASVATCAADSPDCGVIKRGAVALAGERIAWSGPVASLPGLADRTEVIDLQGALLTPGLIDCHTHLVFAGDRSHELEMRQAGASYQDIARAGGGILATVGATRAASEDALLALALARARVLMAEGVTSLEVKSGYGLDLESELKLLRVARRLGTGLPLTVHATLLAAHAVPPEFAGRGDDYMDHVIDTILPAAMAAGLVDSVDAFCEAIAFSPLQVERLFAAAKHFELPVRLHAEQLSNSHGAALAAVYGALSADHLEHLDEAGVRRMASAGSVAVLLPLPFHYLRETRLPPIGMLREHQVPLAVASDFNPGSAPLLSLRLAMQMACTLFGLTATEVLTGVTRNAARALGLEAALGTLAAGKLADLVVWDAAAPAELVTQFGVAAPTQVLRHGAPRELP